VSGTVAELLARCRTAGLKLLVEDDALHVDFESDPPVDLIEEIQQHKPEVMAALSSASVETAVVIAPAQWVAGVAINCPERSFEMPCLERRGLIERRGGVFLHFCVECGRGGPTALARLAKEPGDGTVICIGRMNSNH
jgi:tubulysin polyketide synthase-like protein